MLELKLMHKELSDQIYEMTDSSIQALVRSYHILDTGHSLRALVSKILPGVDFGNCTKHQLHKIIDEAISTRYSGENTLKAKLVEMFSEKDVTAAFELKVYKSRLDFLTVNGETVSYEIKSGIDNLNKLAKQASDYEKVFEYNYLVTDELHLKPALSILPDHYGIYILKGRRLIIKKAALKNCCMEPQIQLQLFTKKELLKYFSDTDPDPFSIALQFDESIVNERFKTMLKKRYEKKWAFLRSNMCEILPVDYQFFFNHNIEPKLIYEA